ncbi:hypothetical protein RND81_10G239200 [Saponaria officinalis]|uniref:Endonuclease/exonuclease/phosphatase domain-containing protein n=1 Tax=Saponaria officinalis TaxID=3572 RepID=A0AAW1I6E9_SAPOF
MSVLSLNCKGLGNPDAVAGLRDLVRIKAPTMIFLCETKLSGREMSKVKDKLEDYDGLEVDSEGRSGGLAFLWRKGIHCEFRSASTHYMDFEVQLGGQKWRVTGFYGWPAVADRYLSWELLGILAQQSSIPWLCIGDYNEVLYSTEMKGGERAQWQMNNFRNATDTCGLMDVPYVGYEYTFDNGQAENDNRQSRIDRAMVTESWWELFPYAKLHHLVREWSDHAPIKLVLDDREGTSLCSKKIFRFEQFWVGEDCCEEAIRRACGKGNENLMETLEMCAKELQDWKGVTIGKVLKDLNTKRRQFERLNAGERSREQICKRKKLIGEIAHLRRQK